MKRGTVQFRVGGVGRVPQVGDVAVPECCFAVGTPLLMPHGAKAIEELQVGDLVLSRDEHDATTR